jgi:multidrug efflux pump subunit AcrB
MYSEIVYPLGTPFDTTQKTIKQIETGAFKLNDYFRDRVEDNKDLIVNTFSLVGVIPQRDWKEGVSGGHCGIAWIEILPSAKRPDILASEVTSKWREFTGDILGTEQSTFTIIGSGPGGNPIEIRLHGSELSQMEAAAQALKEEIASYPGTFDITDDFRPGKMEKQIYIQPGAESLGVTMADIATQLRQGYYGDEVLKIQRGKDDVKVMVRYSKQERETEASIDRLRIRTKDNREIPLNQVARIETQRGYATIKRVDRHRVITVTSDLDEDTANAQNIVKDLSITMISIFGIVALSGIVVNDSLILIDFINVEVAKGTKVFEAVVKSGETRFRPVILTSFTTVAGLAPLLTETSFQAKFLIPMAVSLSFGLVAATALTLIFVPALYVVIRELTLFVTGDQDVP